MPAAPASKPTPRRFSNLAMDKQRYGDLVMAMNAKLNARIEEGVGVDDGSFLPLRDFSGIRF
ncbi:MAG: hypothetical protein WBW74_20845 [Xanthobacteraceae bacterium]